MQLGSPLCTALALEPNSLIDGGLSPTQVLSNGKMCQAVVGLLTESSAGYCTVGLSPGG